MAVCKILGIEIEVGNKDALFERSLSLVGSGGVICTPNPLILSASVENQPLRRALSSADLCIPDGIGLRPFLRAVDKKADVLAGVELGEGLSAHVKTVGLVGGRQGTAEKAFAYLKRKNPSLSSAFLLSGYETPLSLLLGRLQETKPALCLVCLGSPKQEILMHALRAYSPRTLFLGLGGSLDVYAGNIPRAPRPIRAMHLEWLYRMVREPRRFRELPSLLRFPFLCEKYRQKNYKVTKNATHTL